MDRKEEEDIIVAKLRDRSGPKGDTSWTTENELNFIIGLGTHSACGKRWSRLDLLTGYLGGIGQRFNWGGMDREKVFKFTMESMKNEVIML